MEHDVFQPHCCKINADFNCVFTGAVIEAGVQRIDDQPSNLFQCAQCCSSHKAVTPFKLKSLWLLHPDIWLLCTLWELHAWERTLTLTLTQGAAIMRSEHAAPIEVTKATTWAGSLGFTSVNLNCSRYSCTWIFRHPHFQFLVWFWFFFSPTYSLLSILSPMCWIFSRYCSWFSFSFSDSLNEYAKRSPLRCSSKHCQCLTPPARRSSRFHHFANHESRGSRKRRYKNLCASLNRWNQQIAFEKGDSVQPQHSVGDTTRLRRGRVICIEKTNPLSSTGHSASQVALMSGLQRQLPASSQETSSTLKTTLNRCKIIKYLPQTDQEKDGHEFKAN